MRTNEAKNEWGCFHSALDGMKDITGYKIEFVAWDIELYQMDVCSDNLTCMLSLSNEKVPATYSVRII